MSLHAIDDIGDAIDATKAFLLPFSVRTWLKLAFVVLFIGGGGGGGLNQVQSLSNANPGGGQTGPDTTFELTGILDGLVDVALLQTGGAQLPPEAQQALAGAGVVLIAVFLGAVALGLLVGLLSNFMEFVFVQSLVDREVHVRRYFGANLGNGLRLLGFRVAVNLLSLLAAAVIGYLVFLTVLGGSLANLDEAAFFQLFPLLIVFLAVSAVVLGLINGFTNMFVVPLMLQGDHGVLAGWRRLLSSVTDQPKQYVAYVFFSVVLAIGVGLVAGILSLLVFFLLLIPFGLTAYALWLALGHGVLAFVLVGVVVVMYVLLVVGIGLFVRVPLQTFLRYYAMLVLGDVDESLDPIPEVRADIRSEPAGGDGPANADSA